MKTLKKLTSLLAVLALLVSIMPFSIAYDANDAAPTVVLSPQKIEAMGEAVETDAYNIDGYNYFKLRDIAELMNGTDSQFSVSFDENTRTVSTVTGEPYSKVGGELETGKDSSSTCVVSDWTLVVNGSSVDVKVYNLGGNNYFKLRDLGVAFGIRVDYDEITNTAVIEDCFC